MNKRNLLGLDFGTKWVGVAYSEGNFSRALASFSTKEAISKLKVLVQKLAIEEIILGLPLGRIAEMARDFGKVLEKETHLPVTFWDETLTSVGAHENLIQKKANRKSRQLYSHREAAANILESFINYK